VLSGDHNLFNPVTWRRKANGDLLKILKTGPDALTISNIVPLYTIVSYDHASDGGVYVMGIQVHSAKRPMDYAKVGEKTRSGLYTIRGIKGAVDSPDSIQLEISDPDQMVWVTTNAPFQQVDSYMADLKYEPEQHTFTKQKVNDSITLDGELYKIIEITNNLVRVQSIKNTKVTTVRWNGSP
jgi:hypothetical protein